MSAPRSKKGSLPLLAPWYSDGLRFECQPDCGACCTDHGDAQYVYLQGDDEKRLAEFLELSTATFRKRYTTDDDGWRVLRMDRPECPFLEGTACTVYTARPTQCRTFPFWDENLSSAGRWNKLCEFCPGIDRGRRHSVAEIREQGEPA